MAILVNLWYTININQRKETEVKYNELFRYKDALYFI